LLNTENSILESWQGPKIKEPPRKTTYHFAVKQNSLSLDFHLKHIFKHYEIQFHMFHIFEELVTICQRFPIDLILIGGGEHDNFDYEIELVRGIKENVFLSIIPVVLFHPHPLENTIIAAYEKGAEDFIYGDWREKLIEVRLMRVIKRNRRDLSINPSTHLPGPNIIEAEINRLIEYSEEFAICYADLDNFKAYNDYYGYSFGDKVIRLTSRIIKDVVFECCREGFVGHIAGDDYIYIVPPEKVDKICSLIIETFDQLIPYSYQKEDRIRGYITTTDRRGNMEDFSILTMSIAVIINNNGTFKHIGEMSQMMADLKKATKMMEGSNYLVERRQKY